MTPIEEVKSRLDIVEVISGYVPLKQTGSNWRANCPFHAEKTPSFMVSKDKQIWHCFGCSEGGDVISFIQKHESLEFAEALKLLADRAGIVLPAFSSEPTSFKKNVLWDINAEAMKYWQSRLHAGETAALKARQYLAERGLTSESIELWSLGLATESWDGLYNFLKIKFKDEDIITAGLITRKENKIFDRFRQRLMFPIRDAQGKVVGFTGRTLIGHVFTGDDFGGKYVNTPQTPVYNKSLVLYGLDLAKPAIKRMDYCIVVEGNMDVIMSYQAGVQNVVAVSGTALTADQLRILKRFTSNLILAFDSDAAGSQAVYKSGVISAGQFDMNVKVIVLDGAKDPADIVKTDPSAWKEAIRQSKPVMDFYFEEILKRVDLNRADHKKIAVKKILDILAQVTDSVEREHYIKKLAKTLDLSETLLKEQMPRAQMREKVAAVTQAGMSNDDRVSYELLTVLSVFPQCLPTLIDRVEPEMLAESLQSLYKKIIIHYTKNHSTDLNGLAGILEGHEATTWSALVHRADELYNDWETKQFDEEFEKLSRLLKRRWLSLRLSNISKQVAAAEATGQTADVERLTIEFNDVSKKLAEYLS